MSPLTEDMYELLGEWNHSGGGGRKTAKAKYKTKSRGKRMRKRDENPGHTISKKREVSRQAAHDTSRGVKKQRGMKESMEALLEMKRKLTVPERHQLAIAKKTLKMSDAGATVMGGPSKKEAREIILRLTGRKAKG